MNGSAGLCLFPWLRTRTKLFRVIYQFSLLSSAFAFFLPPHTSFLFALGPVDFSPHTQEYSCHLGGSGLLLVINIPVKWSVTLPGLARRCLVRVGTVSSSLPKRSHTR